ncbi:MAG TPA: bifunctional UDP-N-acetylglucosamine diphosphorylase/glucosamine-1-phosphate N-acetyltransferase GlmU [Ktedonobacterales bacterium]|nr:bifunctional UDP-N-acetylglucosamine diphosphorylase/glucosamine-1-phosphate N-acetyltransferase GlmU [Ktedonobacterales bacterium]
MRPVGVLLLAAGKGTRMRSRIPKVAHHVAGRPLLEHVLRAADSAFAPVEGPDSADSSEGPIGEPDGTPHYVVVTGHERDAVRASLRWQPARGALSFVVQEPQQGTGDAARVGLSAFDGERLPETMLILYGDTPLMRPETLRALLTEHQRAGATLTFLTGFTDQPGAYGRVVRDDHGLVRGIVEAKHATPEQLAICEINSGIYCFQTEWLAAHLPRLTAHDNGEYYLTDLVEIALGEGRIVAAQRASIEEAAGINDRIQLAEAEAILRRRVLRDLMLSGVTIEDPATTYVEAGVRIGQDTILRPGTMLRGATLIGERCEIGPYSVIQDCAIGDDCRVYGSWLEGATMQAGARIGPMSRLRSGAVLDPGTHVGNFAEVKNATLGDDVQMHHFGYVGDATIGARTNVGAGVITCNFEPDGKKYRTDVGEDVFIGSDTMLIAPITLGDGARTGAGSVVTRDVPPGGVAVGVPARIRRIHNDAQPAAAPSGLNLAAENSTRASDDPDAGTDTTRAAETADADTTSPRDRASPAAEGDVRE